VSGRLATSAVCGASRCSLITAPSPARRCTSSRRVDKHHERPGGRRTAGAAPVCRADEWGSTSAVVRIARPVRGNL